MKWERAKYKLKSNAFFWESKIFYKMAKNILLTLISGILIKCHHCLLSLEFLKSQTWSDFVILTGFEG